MSTDAVELGSSDHGTWSPPGGQIAKKSATVYRLPSGKYKLTLDDSWGHNQGYFEHHGGGTRSYRHAELDDLMAIALAEEEDKDIRAATRDAIGEAEDTLEHAACGDGKCLMEERLHNNVRVRYVCPNRDRKQEQALATS